MTKDEARERRDKARKRREHLDDEIAERVAEIERLENGIEGRRDDKDDADDPDRRAELKAEIAARLIRRAALKEEIHELRPRREKAAAAVKKWARKLRNLASPKVYDMAFDKSAVRPLYAMGSITKSPLLPASLGLNPLSSGSSGCGVRWTTASHHARPWTFPRESTESP